MLLLLLCGGGGGTVCLSIRPVSEKRTPSSLLTDNHQSPHRLLTPSSLFSLSLSLPLSLLINNPISLRRVSFILQCRLCWPLLLFELAVSLPIS